MGKNHIIYKFVPAPDLRPEHRWVKIGLLLSWLPFIGAFLIHRVSLAKVEKLAQFEIDQYDVRRSGACPTWPDVMMAIDLCRRDNADPITVEIEGPSATIPTGNWDLSNVIIKGTPLGGSRIVVEGLESF